MEKWVVIFALVLIIGAVFLVAAFEGKPQPNAEAEQKIIEALKMGEGVESYTYKFKERYNNFETEYEIIKSGEDLLIKLKSPLSEQQAYFLQNKTIFCINFKGNSACSQVDNITEMEDYMQKLKTLAISDEKIEREVEDFRIMKKYIEFKGVEERPECTQINYTIDFRNISFGDAARFKIGARSPKIFNWTQCISEDGRALYKSMEYETYTGAKTQYEYELLSFKEGGRIEEPQNVSAGAVGLLKDERKLIAKIRGCYSKKGEKRADCIRDSAIMEREPLLCELAEGKRDECYVGLVPLMKEEELCRKIEDSAFKDDCYIEMAGATKDENFCNNVEDESKKEYCREVAQQEEDKPKIDPEELLRRVENA